MNRQENLFDKAWICVGASLKVEDMPWKAEVKAEDTLYSYKMWKKFSCLDFQIFHHQDDESKNCTIGSFGIFHGDGCVLDIVQVLDPHTFKVVVKDIWDLQCKTPIELFMKLDLQGLLVY